MSDARRVRSIDVARLAGVSRSAVSRSFTPGASVAAQTRQRVEAAAAQLGYRPNAIARMLITRRSGTVGIVVSELQNPFYARMLDTLGYQLQRKRASRSGEADSRALSASDRLVFNVVSSGTSVIGAPEVMTIRAASGS
jgi:ABC-type sugar transport system substrate-binding protein